MILSCPASEPYNYFLSFFQVFFKFCLIFCLFVPLTCLVLQWSVSRPRASVLYLQEHIAQQCPWEWVFRIGLLTSINCNELFCKSDLRDVWNQFSFIFFTWRYIWKRPTIFHCCLYRVFTMESGGFALGLDFKIETATCELSPERYMTAL